MLEVNCLGFEYRSGGRGISGVTFSAAAAQLTALVGPSGSGKSTLLACIAGILRPREGDVSLDGRDQGSDISAWRRDVAFIPQSSSVFERLTIWENVAVAWGEPAVRSRPRAVAVLEELGIAALAEEYPSRVSRGQRQRSAIAVALGQGARLILADEPTGSLDDANAHRVLAALRTVSIGGAAIVIATHDRTLVAAADAVVHLPTTPRIF